MKGQRSLLELWGLSNKIYDEIVFQSVFSLRTGGVLPQEKELSRNSLRKIMLFIKLLPAFIIVILNFSWFLLSALLVFKMGDLTPAYHVTNIICIVFYFFAIWSMNEINSFVSSRVFEFLITLPLSRKDVSKILLMSFTRIFDALLIVTTIIIPLTFGIFYNSVLGAFSILLGIITAEIFGASIALSLTSYFYFKVIAKGKSIWSMVFTIFWSFSFFTHIPHK